MVYESSYESGRSPFKPDAIRGYWAQPSDFVYACWALAFKLDIFSISWFIAFEAGIFGIIPYLICLTVYVVPIILIQSFLGQFSSSGYLSAFRISPLFKGMGYISLAVNFSILTYYSIFAAIPLIFFVHALRPTLPWSCDSLVDVSKSLQTDDEYLTLCNITHNNGSVVEANSSSEEAQNESSSLGYQPVQIPSVEFFRTIVQGFEFYSEDFMELAISWQLVLCVFFVWTMVAVVFYKVINAEKMGQLIRYTVWLLMALLFVCVLRFAFLTDARDALEAYFYPQYGDIGSAIAGVLIFSVSFGPGWGAIVSLSSYNHFKTNIMRFSWFVALGQMVIMMLFDLATFLINRHFLHITDDNYYTNVQQHWILYLSSGSAMVNMELANMWCLLFFGLLTISSMLIIVTELFCLLTAIFDNFEYLRPKRLQFTFGLIACLALSSIYFCSNHGLTYYTALSADAFFTQTALNLLLLLMVLWVYGRERFQRDIEFMLCWRFPTWKVYVLRFIAPLALLLTLLIAGVIAYHEHYFSSIIVGIVAIFLIAIPWLFIPGYAIFSVLQTSGPLLMRLKRCCHPTDWYPVESDERQRYEEAMGNMDITHQLNEVADELI